MANRLTRLLALDMNKRPPPQSDFERSVEAMARDPQIQREIKAINEEFACTEMDGLENL